MEFYFDEIEYCEEIGIFENEYVYDVEVDDNTHTFIANDILVHNSCYVTFAPALKSCDYAGNPVDFILKIKEFRLNAYLKKKFEEYAAKFNTKNIQDLELEKISYSSIMVAKKKYILDLAWKDPGVFYKPQEKIKFTGVEIMQGSTPKFARKALKELIKMACEKGKNLQYADVVKRLKEYKKEYVLQNPEDIAKTQALGDYEKYCLEDKKVIRLAEKCPQNVRASAVYNHMILNGKWKAKYNLIKTGDKVKYYYTKDENEVFGFLPGNFPYEFAPAVDYDLQFDKTIIEPFNRILDAMGFNPVPGNLIYAKSLF
jgi:DNA polymerase family B